MDDFLLSRFTGIRKISARGERFLKPRIEIHMEIGDHLRLTGSALKHWAIAQCKDSLVVGLLWLIGLLILRVPLAPLWAGFAALLQFIPNLGAVLGLIGPLLAAAMQWTDWRHPLYVLILYVIIVVVDGLLLQPYIMKRTSKVPIWASVLVPLAMGIVWPFWGILIAPPLLAVFYAYRARHKVTP
jgi:predicted PurR-regulated permease PerM